MHDDRYQQLYEHSTAAILTLDCHGHVVDCNRLACRLLLRGRGEILGESFPHWLAAPERGGAAAHLRTAFGGEATDFHSSILRSDGTTRPVIVRLVPHATGETDRVDALVVTPAQAGNMGGGEALRPLLENLPNQFALVLDAHYRIRHSAGVARTHWLNDEDVLGDEVVQLLDQASANAQQTAEMRSELAAGRPWGGRHQHRRADGSVFLVEAYALPNRDTRTGSIIGALYAGRDISAEHELRMRSARADRLAAIGDLVVSVAVELQRALNRASDLSEAGGKQREDALKLELHRTSELVEKLLAFASGTPLDRSEVALGSVVNHVLKQSGAELEAAGVRVVTRIAHDLPLLSLDEAHITRVLRELLQNGVEAMDALPSAGKELRISATAEGSALTILIEDQGPGIPAAIGDRVFEPFYTTKRARFGLGLAVARGIVTAHDGRLSLHRSAAGSTQVVLQLPLRAADTRKRFRAVPLILRSRSVLIVEDDESVRRMYKKALETVGYRVTEAFSGRNALAQLNAGDLPDLMITDLKMAGGNGYWLIEKMRSDFPALLARTIIITGNSGASTLEQIESATGCPALGKPVEFPVLLEALDDLALRAEHEGANKQTVMSGSGREAAGGKRG